ncbi:MAG: hypothetical protein ACFFCT_05835 [Candidatus Odinarchaeota archaeon]
MSPKKHYFDEPIVSVDLSRVRFPKTCPVCGACATALSRMTIVTGRPQYLRHEWDPHYNPSVRRKGGIPQPNLKVLPIQVCADHYYTDEGEDRYKSLCLIVDGLAMAFMFFGLIFLGDSISRGRLISPWVTIFVAIFIMSMVITVIVFRPNALARSVKIIGFDAGMQHILLEFKSTSYRDEFIKENAMHSELVRWVMKTDG